MTKLITLIDPDAEKNLWCYAENNLTKERIQEAFNKLTPREQKILEMRFGLEDGVTYTLQGVASEFGVTRERIKQIEAKALEKLRMDNKFIKSVENITN